jgi:isoquinoline 1-oxidoreductase beta subunit
MKNINPIHRREFIRLSAMSGVVLALGLATHDDRKRRIVNLSAVTDPGKAINAYIFIDRSGKITLYNHRPEMGQGTFQAIPMIIAEELDVDIEKIEIMQSPADRSKYGDQMVVGSRSIQSNFELMRKIGASAREMLITAAAARWMVKTEDCFSENANVVHRTDGKRLPYAELVEEASKLPIPKNPRLKDPKNFSIIGKPIPRKDIAVKINGEAKYGIDYSLPGMLYASIERSPVFLGKIVSIDDSRAKAVPGVKHVLKTQREVFGYNREAVAVLAENYWAAVQGRKLLQIVWDNADLESWSTLKIKENYRKAAAQKGVVFEEKGKFGEAFADAKIKLEAYYETPYQSHAPMEPMNALVNVEKDKCSFWGSTQNPNGIRSHLAKQCNLPEENVTVNYTFMGGGFGRRSMTDVAEEAADLSMKTGMPVKVIWTREDDLTQGPFRACSLNVCKGGINERGELLALEHKVICQDIRNQSGNNNRASEGIAGGINTEYAIPNFSLSGVLRKFYIPIYYWRSVYHSTNCFAHESFMDELAHAAKKDPLEFRLSLLKDHKRYTRVLEAVAENSGWHKSGKKDTGKGLAIAERSGAFVAMVVEVEKMSGKLKVSKVTAAIDCGWVVNPDIVKAQTEGCIVMGLTAAYKSGITIEKGKVVEQNFNSYKMLEMGECPEIEVTVIKSEDPPEGAGEAGLPTVAAALANAIFSLTGRRLRTLPLKFEEL